MKKLFLILCLTLVAATAQAIVWPNPHTTSCGYWVGECENSNDVIEHAETYVEGRFTGQQFLNQQGEFFAVRIFWNNMSNCKRSVLRWKGKASGMSNPNHFVIWTEVSLILMQGNVTIAGCQPTGQPGNPPPAPEQTE